MSTQRLLPQQQKYLNDLIDQAFVKRMKEALFPKHEHTDFVTSKFMLVLKKYGFNTTNVTAADLKAIGEEIAGANEFSYFQIGTILNCVMGASFQDNEVPEGIADIVKFKEKLEAMQDVYNVFVAKSQEAARRETKVKLELTNNPLSNFL